MAKRKEVLILYFKLDFNENNDDKIRKCNKIIGIMKDFYNPIENC